MSQLLTSAFDRLFFRATGQRVSTYSRMFDSALQERYRKSDEDRWITLKPNGGKGTPVQIDGTGKIVAGPKELSGRTVSSLGKQSTKTKRNQAIKAAAKSNDIKPSDLAAAVKEVWPQFRRDHQEREDFKARARKLSGLTEQHISRQENTGLDHSTVTNFDQVAEELSHEYPQYFSSDDPSADLWDVLREGKVEAPAMHSDEVIGHAVDMLLSSGYQHPSRATTRTSGVTIVDGEHIPFSRSRHQDARSQAYSRMFDQVFVDRYGHKPKAGQDEFKWITIGGDSDSNSGEKHIGGTPVKIDSKGVIVSHQSVGALHGKHISKVGKDDDQSPSKPVLGAESKPKDQPKPKTPEKPEAKQDQPKQDHDGVKLFVKQMPNGRWYAMADLPNGHQVTRSHEDKEQAIAAATGDVEKSGHSVAGHGAEAVAGFDKPPRDNDEQSKLPAMSATGPDGNPVEFRARSGESQLAMVDVGKLNEAWRGNPDNFVEPGGKNEIGDRINRFGDWFSKRGDQPVEPPQVAMKNGTVDFADGRHRFNWFIDQGWDKIPVEAHPEDIAEIESRFGVNSVSNEPTGAPNPLELSAAVGMGHLNLVDDMLAGMTDDQKEAAIRDALEKHPQSDVKNVDLATRRAVHGAMFEMSPEDRARADADHRAKVDQQIAETAKKVADLPEPDTSVDDSNPTAEESKPEPKTGLLAFDDAIDEGKSPREAAEAADKADQSEYEFARASSVGNVGEDLKGSARHKRNEWRSLEDAEADGTAAEMVTRDNLLKNEPHNLMDHADSHPMTAVAMHLALKKFPAKPGPSSKRAAKVDDETAKKDRRQFLETYRSLKSKAEELAATEVDPIAALAKLESHVRETIYGLRGQTGGAYSYAATDRYNNTANGLVGLHKGISKSHRPGKTHVLGRLAEWAKASVGENPDKNDLPENLREAAKSAIEGGPLVKKGSKGSKFSTADKYVKKARRTGGKDLSAITSDPNKATSHMVDHFGMRGIQWGNSVTDDERQHHAARVVESFTDLGDVVGLPPSVLALNGKLGLAIGARGKGNAAAHYEPGSQVINLTRKSGVGSLAHEWGHGFDHLLEDFSTYSNGARYASEQESPESFEWTKGEGHKYTNRSGDPLWKAMDDLRKTWESSGFKKRLGDNLSALEKDGLLAKSGVGSGSYFKSTREVFARTFESYVAHKLNSSGRENTYLSGVRSDEVWPNEAEVSHMAPMFDALFAAYREKNGITEKYSRAQLRAHFNALLSPHKDRLSSAFDAAASKLFPLPT